MRVKNSNRIYNNIFFSMTITVAITIFILSSILYANFEQIALSLIYSSSRDNLTQVSHSVDFMTKIAKSLAQQIYYDPKITQLLFFSSQAMQETDALQQLDNYRYSNTSFINSIYVYSRKSDDLYLSLPSNSNAVQNVNELYDKGMASILDNIGRYKRFEVIPRRVPVPVGSRNTIYETNAYSFIYYESVTGGKPDGAVILNISEEWIHDTMNSLNNDPVQNTFIINNKGVMLSSTKTENMLTDISQESYIKRVLASGKANGYIVENVKQVNSLVTYVTLAPTNWKFIMVTPYGNVVGKIKNMQYYTIIIGFVILFAGLLSSLLMTKKIYKPIDSVLQKLNSLKKEKQENTGTLKQEFLRSLLQGKIDNETGPVKSKFDRFDIKLNAEDGFIIFILRIDRYADFCNKYNHSDRSLFKFAIGNISSEICSGYFRSESIDAGEDHVAVLANINTDISPEYGQIQDEIAHNIYEMVKTHLDISLSITVSSAGNAITEISRIYNEAIEYSNCRLFKGHGCIMHVKDDTAAHPKEYVYPAGKEEQLINRLMLGKILDVKEVYKEIIHSASDYSYAAFNIALLRVFSTVNAAIINLSKSNAFTLNYNSDTFLKELNRLETIEEINDRFFKLFEYVTVCINDRKASKHDDLLNRINLFICDKYADSSLCLNTIADHMDMSPVYLGRLFKNLTLKSIGDYINAYRMTVAKELLEKTGYSINDIAEKTGVLNTSHFYTIFKQEYGVTPNEYRKACK